MVTTVAVNRSLGDAVHAGRHEPVKIPTGCPHRQHLLLAREPTDDAGFDGVVVAVQHLAVAVDEVPDDARQQLERIAVHEIEVVGILARDHVGVNLVSQTLHPSRRLLEILRLDQTTRPSARARAVVSVATAHAPVGAHAIEHGLDLLNGGVGEFLIQRQDLPLVGIHVGIHQCPGHGVGSHVRQPDHLAHLLALGGLKLGQLHELLGHGALNVGDDLLRVQ